jgi:multicomponent Na+:H+ antiporter subunit G
VSWTVVLGTIFLWIGLGVMVTMSIGVLAVPDFFDRLHFTSAVATPGAGLVLIGLAVQADTWHDAGKLLVIAALLVTSGTAGTAITARAALGPRPDRRTGP